jgi:mitochondrial fission protein ELM1
LSAPLHILIVSDGKAGHENQSLGLAEAMARRAAIEIHVVRLEMRCNPMTRILKALAASRKFPVADFVIGAGHRTHFPLLAITRLSGARSVVLMKPGVPMCWFDWCVAPEHDFQKTPDNPHLILSKGALNRVVPAKERGTEKWFLIGGPSKIHGFDEEGLISRIRDLACDGQWQVADSRRTPGDFLRKLEHQIPNLPLFPHQDTASGWLAGKLSGAAEVWVTEDSVSMVYEALTGGAKVGVLEMPRLKPNARVIRGLEKLKDEGYLVGHGTGEQKTLAEADRCAGEILRTYGIPG